MVDARLIALDRSAGRTGVLGVGRVAAATTGSGGGRDVGSGRRRRCWWRRGWWRLGWRSGLLLAPIAGANPVVPVSQLGLFCDGERPDAEWHGLCLRLGRLEAIYVLIVWWEGCHLSVASFQQVLVEHLIIPIDIS